MRLDCERPDGAAIGPSTLSIPFLILAIDGLGYGACLPILPFAMIRLGGSAADYAYVISCYGCARLLGAPSLGWLSDRIRPEILVAQSCILIALASIFAALHPGIATMFLAFAIFGIASGRGSPLRVIALRGMDSVRQRSVLSRLAAAGLVGGSMGPLAVIVITLWRSDPLAQIQTCLAAIAIVNILILIVLFARFPFGSTPDEPESPRADERGKVTAALLPALIASIASFAAQAVLLTNLSLFVFSRLHWHARETAIMLGVSAIIGAVARLVVAPRLLSRYEARQMLPIAALAAMAALLLMAPANSVTWFVCSFMMSAATVGMLNALPAVLANEMSRAGTRGTAFGLVQATSSIGTIVGAAAVGLIASGIGVGGPFYLAGSMLLALGAYSSWNAHRETRENKPGRQSVEAGR